MGTLLAILGTGKGTWNEVHSILALKAFEHAILFVDDWAAKDYRNEFSATIVPIPGDAPLETFTSIFKDHLEKHATPAEFDMAVNIASGTGKQHAALLAAVITSGYGMRLVGFENGTLKVLT